MVEAGQISHTGRIVSIDPQTIRVEIVSEDACASCHAASLCGVSNGKVKLVDVPATLGYEVGEEVEVLLRRSMGFKAVWLAYVGPLVVLVAVLLALLSFGISEPVSGLCSIAAAGVWYLVIWLLRDRLKNEYTFYIKKK